MFFPDVSTKAHGNYLPKAFPNYELVFTTKTFQIKDLKELYNLDNVQFIPHGFDPEIHRPLPISEEDKRNFSCDVSFIGTWSPKKEQWLTQLKGDLPHLDLKIWGSQWFKSSSDTIKNFFSFVRTTYIKFHISSSILSHLRFHEDRFYAGVIDLNSSTLKLLMSTVNYLRVNS